MIKKKIRVILLMAIAIIIVMLVTIMITHTLSIEYYKYYGKYNNGVKHVNEIPDIFTSIKNLKEDTDGKLSYTYGPHNIIFQDSDNIILYSILYTDDDIILEYNDEYYIDDLLYDDLINKANIIAEQRNRLYNIGDMVILRGREIIPWVIIIDSAETENIGNDEVLTTIHFKINLSVSEDDRMKMFDHVETDKGTIIGDFIFIDEETVQVKLPADEKVNMIVLKSPDFKGCIRKIYI